MRTGFGVGSLVASVLIDTESGIQVTWYCLPFVVNLTMMNWDALWNGSAAGFGDI